jgi:hypothetical protein
MTFIDTTLLSVKEPEDGWKGRFFHSQSMTFAYYAVRAGAVLDCFLPERCRAVNRRFSRSGPRLRWFSVVSEVDHACSTSLENI